MVRQARKALAAQRQQRQDKITRLVDATKRLTQLNFTVCFMKFSDLVAYEKLVPHEVARGDGKLIMIDDF